MSRPIDKLAWLPSWFQDPLIHFLLIGGVLFAAYRLIAPGGDDYRRIVVNRDALINFAQYKVNTFNFDLLGEGLNELTLAERHALVDEYVRDEALYREALALGLDQGDYVIRQRLIQRLEFMFEDNTEPGNVGKDELNQFYEDFSDDYVVPTVYSFTHVFFNAELRGNSEARGGATEMLKELNKHKIPFHRSVEFGDRPLFFQNYIERTRDYVEANLGPDLINMLDQVDPSTSTWYGPVQSPYGWHLVLLASRDEATMPELTEIENRLREDYAIIKKEQVQQQRLDQIVNSYEVHLVGIDP